MPNPISFATGPSRPKRKTFSTSPRGAYALSHRRDSPRSYGHVGRPPSHPAAQAQRLGAAVPLPEGIEWTTFLRQYRYRLPAWVYWYGL